MCFIGTFCTIAAPFLPSSSSYPHPSALNERGIARGAGGGVAGAEAEVSCSPTRYAHVATVGHQQLLLIVIVIVLIVVLVIVALWQQPVLMCLYSLVPHPHLSPLLTLSLGAVLGGDCGAVQAEATARDKHIHGVQSIGIM